MSSRPLLTQSLSLLHIIGVSPLKQSKWTKLRACGIVLILSFLLFEEMASLIFKSTGWDALDAAASGGGLFQMIGKFIFLIIQRKKFVVFLQNFEQFWPWDSIEKEMQEEISETYKFVKKCIRAYASTFVFTALAYSIRPLTTPERDLPITTYHPSDYSITYRFLLMYFVEVFDTSIGVLLVFLADYVFISFVSEIICEIKILKHKFITMDTQTDYKKCLQDVDHLIEHHSMLLICVGDLNDIYSGLLLFQFSASLILLCLGLVGMIISGFPPDIEHLSNYSSYMLVIFNQLLIFCLAGEYLTAELESVSNAVYASDWYTKTHPELRRRYTLVILRANIKEQLTAGGLFNLDLQSFTNIVNKALSFYTVAMAVYVPQTD